MTIISSQSLIVLSLCAIIRHEQPLDNIASFISFSVEGSSALVASSKTKIEGFIASALAISIRCF